MQEPPHGEHSTSAGSGGGATLQDATRERPRRGEVPVTDEAGKGREQIDLGEDRVVGEAVRVGLRVREVDRHGSREKVAKNELTESELPGEHCGGAATSLGLR